MIESKISLLSNVDKGTNFQTTKMQDILKVVSDINKMAGSINVFDGSQQTTKKADNYFSDLAVKIKSDNKSFIKVSNLQDKPDIILAIKINEITFLDRILQDHNIYSSDSTKSIH